MSKRKSNSPSYSTSPGKRFKIDPDSFSALTLQSPESDKSPVPQLTKSVPKLPTELQLQSIKDLIASWAPLDISLKRNHKPPQWILDFGLSFWQSYWRYIPLYVPGEAWLRVPSRDIQNKGVTYEQPWRNCLHYMLRFAERFFGYEKDDKHPAGLAEYRRPARDPLVNDGHPTGRQHITFEVLVVFSVDHHDEDFCEIFHGCQPTIYHINLRALLRLYQVLECNKPENRDLLNIKLKWKDGRKNSIYSDTKALKWRGAPEDDYFNTDAATKADIRTDLGIAELYMNSINKALEVWSDYLNGKKYGDFAEEKLLKHIADTTAYYTTHALFPKGKRTLGYVQFWAIQALDLENVKIDAMYRDYTRWLARYVRIDEVIAEYLWWPHKFTREHNLPPNRDLLSLISKEGPKFALDDSEVRERLMDAHDSRESEYAYDV